MPAFVAGALEGDTKSMMTSYHALNGIPASASPVIRSQLREALGWEGMMMSDGGAISYMLNFKSNEAMKDLPMLTARPSPERFRVPVCAARTLNAAGQSQVTLSLR